MSTITLPNIRVGSDLQVRVRLKDGGVAIDWSTLQNIKACIYSDAQRALAGRCSISIDAEDPTLLVCNYAANKPQYLGANRVVISVKYLGETKTYDKPAFTFVRWTDDQAGEQITIDDPDVDVEIEVEDISSSLLQEAVDAAFAGAERANEAAAAAEHMVDIHTGPEGKSAYQVAVEEGYTGTEEEWLASLVGPQGPQGIQGETGEAAGFGAVSVTLQEDGGQPGATVASSGPDTAKNFGFTFKNLKGEKGDKGDQGNTGSSVDYPFELVNNETTDDATKAHTAAGAKRLKDEVSQLEAESFGFNADMDVAVVQGEGMNTGNNPAYLTKTLSAGSTYRLYPVGDALLRITPRLRSTNNTEVTATWVNVETQAESTASEKSMDIGAAYDITPDADVSRIAIYYSAGNAVGTGNVVLQIRNSEKSMSDKINELEAGVEALESEIDGIPEEVSALQKQVNFLSDGLVKTVEYTDTSVGLIKTDGTIDESPSSRRISPYIPFLGDTTIYNAFTGSSTSYTQVAFYDENYNYLTYRRGPSNTTEDTVLLNKADYPNASFLRYALPTPQAECKATMPASVIEVVQRFSYSPNYGKSVSLFGASFSAEQSGYYAYAALNKWREQLGFDITNYSTPGAGFTPAASSLIQTQVDTACADGVEATDIYIIWASANDFGGQGTIGVNSDYTIDDSYNPAHLNTFCGGLNYCIKKILTKAPTAKIILLTSLRNGHLDSGRNPYSTGSGNNLAKYVDAEKECCYRYGVPYLDQYAMFPMNEFTKDYYLQEDGRHPNVLCYELLADMQIPFLASI